MSAKAACHYWEDGEHLWTAGWDSKVEPIDDHWRGIKRCMCGALVKEAVAKQQRSEEQRLEEVEARRWISHFHNLGRFS